MGRRRARKKTSLSKLGGGLLRQKEWRIGDKEIVYSK